MQMSPRSAGGLLLFGGGILTGAVLWSFWGPAQGSEGGVEPTSVSEEEIESSSGELAANRQPVFSAEPEAEELPATSLRDYLRETWGDRWPELEQQLLEAEVDLDRDVDLSAFPSWEEVAPLARDMAIHGTVGLQPAYEGDLTPLLESIGDSLLKPLPDRRMLESHPDFNPEGKRITKHDYERLREIETRHGTVIYPIVEAYLAANQSYRAAQWELGNFEHGLFHIPDAKPDPMYSGRIEVTSGTVNGWLVDMYFQVEDDPLLQTLLADLESLSEAKEGELKAYIAGL